MVPMSSVIVRLRRTLILSVGKQGPKGKTGSDSVDLCIHSSRFSLQSKREDYRISRDCTTQVRTSRRKNQHLLCKVELKFTDNTGYRPYLSTFALV
jgi:hypothetical protein